MFDSALVQDSNLGGNQSASMIDCDGTFELIYHTPKVAAAWVNALTKNDLYHTIETLSFAQTTEDSEHGIIYKITIKLFHPKVNDLDSIEAFKKREVNYLIDFTDFNGSRRLAGSTANPMRMLVDETIEAQVRGKNGYMLTFYLETNIPTAFVI